MRWLAALLWTATLALAQERSQCAICHEQESARIWSDLRSSAHSGQVDCADCHGGDPSAVEPDRAHDVSAGFAPRPAGQSLNRACAACHASEAASFDRSPHAGALHFTGQPSCASCHQPHLVATPDLGETCATCHEGETDAAARVAADIVGVLRRSNEEVRACRARIDAVVGASEAKLRFLRAEHERLSALQGRVATVSHSLSVEELRVAAEEIDASARTAASVAESNFDHERGFSMSTVVLIFAAAALGLLLVSVLLAFWVVRLMNRHRLREAR